MRIGILGCGFSCEDQLEERLNPWFEAAKQYDMIFSFVSARFKEYEDLNIYQDNTLTAFKLENYYNNNLIQYLQISKESLSEAEARNLALQNLLKANVDYVWLLDLSDEFYTVEQINNIIHYIEKEEFITWFSIPFKNYIFDGKQYILGFCPPRIFKTISDSNVDLHTLRRFYWDNDVYYGVGDTLYSYEITSGKSIPKNLLNGGIRHLTWLHSNGKEKEAYQRKHFKGICSYKFNNETNKLEFDLEHYRKYNLSLPEVFYDN